MVEGKGADHSTCYDERNHRGCAKAGKQKDRRCNIQCAKPCLCLSPYVLLNNITHAQARTGCDERVNTTDTSVCMSGVLEGEADSAEISTSSIK